MRLGQNLLVLIIKKKYVWWYIIIKSMDEQELIRIKARSFKKEDTMLLLNMFLLRIACWQIFFYLEGNSLLSLLLINDISAYMKAKEEHICGLFGC